MDTQRVEGQQAGERGTSAMRSKNFVDGELVEWGEKFFDTSKFWGGAGRKGLRVPNAVGHEPAC